MSEKQLEIESSHYRNKLQISFLLLKDLQKFSSNIYYKPVIFEATGLQIGAIKFYSTKIFPCAADLPTHDRVSPATLQHCTKAMKDHIRQSKLIYQKIFLDIAN